MDKPVRLTKAQIQEREDRIWALSCKGKTVRTIGQIEGIHWTTVQTILDRICKRHLKAQMGRVHHRKMLKSGQVEQIIEYALELHAKAMEPRTRVVEKIDESGSVVRSTEVVEGVGDKGALHTALSAIDRYLRMWGMEILPASQEMADTIAAVVQGIRDRALNHKQATQALDQPATPEGAAPADPPRAEGVPGEPGPVQ